jgi:rod shape-determining protein MreC
MDTLIGRYRNVSILAAAIFLQIVGLAVQVKRRSENQSTRLIRVWTVATVTPLERNIVRFQTGVSDLWHNYLYLRGVRQQNRELQDQIQQLQLEQVRLRQDAEQARRLQALLGFKEQFIDKTIAAQVIGSSGSEQSRIVYLDKGSADGITQDMAVISAQGVVGKVIQVFRHTAQVLLINDQTSGVGTILEQSRLQGVLKGKATGELVLDKIMAEEEVKPGDRVLTSGGDQIFPKGLPVGTVADVTRGSEFLQVTVRPAASLNHLEEVLVITKKQEREPTAVSAAAPVRAADILAQRLPSVPDKPEQPATGSTVATDGLSGTVPAKPQPKATTTAAGTAASAHAPVPNADASTTVPKAQAPTPAPRTQPMDFVRTTPATSNQATGLQPKPKANPLAGTPGSSGGGQAKTPAVSAAAQPKDLSPTSAPAKVPAAVGTNAPTAIKPAPRMNTAASGATLAPKTNLGKPATSPGSQTNLTGPTTASVPKKTSTSAAPQPKPLKPAVPPATKPVPNTPKPSTQSDVPGDAPQ